MKKLFPTMLILLFSSIAIAGPPHSKTIFPINLSATNSLTDNYVPSYDVTTKKFTWVTVYNQEADVTQHADAIVAAASDPVVHDSDIGPGGTVEGYDADILKADTDDTITARIGHVYQFGAAQTGDPGNAQVYDIITCAIASWNPGGLSGTDNYRILVTALSGSAIDTFVVIDDAAGNSYESNLHIAHVSILDPDGAQAVSDTVTILPIEAEIFPNGITIHDIGIKIDDNNLAYVITVEEWTDPATHANDLETITASTGDSTYEYEDDGTIGNGSGGSAGDCNAGSIIKADLPTTDGVGELTVWISYSIN